MPTPCPLVQLVARKYNQYNGLPAIVEGHYVPLDETQSETIARVYEFAQSTPNIEYVQQAYTQLAIEIEQQWAFAIAMGFTFEPWKQDGQPYATSKEMQQDVCNNYHLYFFQGGSEIHPLLAATDEQGLSLNDKFRAIHDFFGHAAEGFQFGPRGEENAWVHHSMMFSPLAQMALTTETRGQNSWFNFGPYRDLAPQDRPFAEQKCFLLPVQWCDWRAALAR